jgi:hypothetical protein
MEKMKWRAFARRKFFFLCVLCVSVVNFSIGGVTVS